MRFRLFTPALAIGVALALVGPAGQAQAAQAAQQKAGNTSLASVLAADGHHFDHNRHDFDILDKVVGTVLAAKPKSSVAVLADGSVRLTAFLPTDLAFKRLAKDLTGHWIHSEKRVYKTLAKAAGVGTLEAVLLYHVVPGATITYKQAKKADGAKLATALDGAKIRVNVRHGVHLRDKDPNDLNPKVLKSAKNINKGNKQIAHGINRVLRPINL